DRNALGDRHHTRLRHARDLALSPRPRSLGRHTCGSAAASGAGVVSCTDFRSSSACWNSSHTGAKTAQTIESVMAIRMKPSKAMTTPDGPNAWAFLFSVGPIQSGAVPMVPPSTKAPSRAPGRSFLVDTLLRSRKRGVQSQKTTEMANQTGMKRGRFEAPVSVVTTNMIPRKPAVTKYQIVNRIWSLA